MVLRSDFEKCFSGNPDAFHEYRMVKLTLRVLGWEDRERELRKEESRYTGDESLTFASFSSLEPEFPIILRSHAFTSKSDIGKYSTVSHRLLARMLTKFSESRIGRHYRYLVEELSPDAQRPIGLVFPHGRIRGGLILHNGELKTTLRPQRLTIEVANFGQVFVEPYVRVLEAIRGGVVTLARSLAPPRTFDAGLPVPPRLRKELGHGVETMVLALIGQLLTRKLWGGWLDFVRYEAGERWAVIEISALAQALVCSESSVKKAVQSLVERGYLIRRRGFAGPGNPSGYRLPSEIIEACIY